MQALCDQLGDPQRAYRSLHVVGTNGKSSVTLLCAALLEAAGLRTGACVSPHIARWSERTRIGAEQIGSAGFEAATTEVAAAVAEVERSLPADQRVTQFEAAIAISFVAFRAAGIEVAVVEAGLGGRLDATNVIPSSATALTSVALDHTDWLGETAAEIAAEKLAVLREGTTLVVGALDPAIEARARAAAEARGCAFIRAPEPAAGTLPPGLAPYLRRNAGVAAELAAVDGPRPAATRIAAAVAGVPLRGRFELIEGEPPLLLDAAHNVEGAAALAEALPALAAGRPVFGCCSLLDDKDIGGFAAALAPALTGGVICTEAHPGAAMGRPGAAPAPAQQLAAAFVAAGAPARAVTDPAEALAATRNAAAEAAGVALCAGSHYILGYAWTGKRDPSSSR